MLFVMQCFRKRASASCYRKYGWNRKTYSNETRCRWCNSLSTWKVGFSFADDGVFVLADRGLPSTIA